MQEKNANKILRNYFSKKKPLLRLFKQNDENEK